MTRSTRSVELSTVLAVAAALIADGHRLVGQASPPLRAALDAFRERLADLLRQLDARPWPVGAEKSVVKPEAAGALHYVALTGPTERGSFIAMTGLPARTARRVLSSLLDYGLLNADSHVGPVSFNVPLRSLRWLFPRLWPEADDPEAP